MPGIDDGTIASVKLWSGPGEPVAFAVWSDLPSQSWSASSGSRGAHVEWRLYAPDGRQVEARYEAQVGKTGEVVIDGRRFDPAKGKLLLVGTDRQPIRIEQVEFDLARLPLDDAGHDGGGKTYEHEDRPVAVRALAESEPRIGAFFGLQAAETPAADKPVAGDDAIDSEAIERIENKLDEGATTDSFPPYTGPPVGIEARPIERP
jgi:hypothetical protein